MQMCLLAFILKKKEKFLVCSVRILRLNISIEHPLGILLKQGL